MGTTTYQHDGLGNRIGMTHNNVETAYLLDPSGALSQVLRESTGGVNTLYLHGLDIIGQQQGSAWTTLGYDPLGSVRFLLDSSGDLTHALNYDPGAYHVSVTRKWSFRSPPLALSAHTAIRGQLCFICPC